MFRFAVDHEFSSPSLAAGVVIDGNSNGSHWKDNVGAKSLVPENSGTLTRLAIEAAMDAYDGYRQSGEHAAIFEAFGEPRDYWVRSTRERPNRVYPSKPIVGFLRGKTQLNGGWGQKAYAAAQLHNAGYIIVDSDDRPIERPDQNSHLASGRVRVQLCAANYYIEPAKEIGTSKVSIRAGDLRADLAERTRTICAALSDENLQRLAGVPKPQLRT